MIPVAAAVASGQQHAGAGMQKRVREAAGCPAGLGVDETDGPQRAGNAGVLQLPVAAAVAAVPDRAASPTAQPCSVSLKQTSCSQASLRRASAAIGSKAFEGAGPASWRPPIFAAAGLPGDGSAQAGGRLAFQAEDFPGVVAQPGGIRVRGLHEPGQGQNYQSGHGMGLSSVGSRRRERRLVDCMAAQGAVQWQWGKQRD